MENKYMVRVESSNPDFQTDKDMQNGIEADGYLLVLFDKEGNPIVEALNAVSTFSIARYLAADAGRVSNILRQAGAIADGLLEAREIEKKSRREKVAMDLAEILRSKE